MTYILGAKCKDGVVLIADKKITSADATVDYEDKLLNDIPWMVVGSSGVSGLFEKFRQRITAYVLSNQNTPKLTYESLTTEIENITFDLNQAYRDKLRGDTFDVLLGLKTAIEANLQYIHPIGFAEPVRRYKVIGHGEPYGSMFLKLLWDKNMTMEEVAGLGWFIIKMIEVSELDGSVGVGEVGTPQVFFIPNSPAPAGASLEELKKHNPYMPDDALISRLYSETQTRLEKRWGAVSSWFKLPSS